MNICLFEDNKQQLRELETFTDECVRKHKFVCDYAIHGFSDVEPFEAFCAEQSAAIYLLDIGVPDNEAYGIEAAGKIRARDRSCHILFITAYEHLVHDSLRGMIKPSGYIFKDGALLNELEIHLTQVLRELSVSPQYISLTLGKTKRFEAINGVLYARYDHQTRKTVVVLAGGRFVGSFGKFASAPGTLR
jgi:DNA-binding LytR/AlgR family response regulator